MSDVEKQREEIGYRLSYKQLYMPIILIIGPLLALGMLFNILYYNFKINPILNLAIITMGGALTVITIYSYYLKIASELHGRKTLCLTFRESRDRVWYDFALIKEIRKIAGEQSRNLVKGIGLSNPPPIIPLEITFDQFMFEKMIVLSPCEEEHLMDFTPDTILWKGFLPLASVASFDVTRVAEIKKEDKYIPIVVPTGCSFITENIQKAASYFDVSKEDINNIALPGGEYDRWQSVELKELLITREAELASALAALKDFNKAVEEVANAKVKSYLKTRKFQRLPLPGWLKLKKFWLFLGLVALLIFLLWLFFGR